MRCNGLLIKSYEFHCKDCDSVLGSAVGRSTWKAEKIGGGFVRKLIGQIIKQGKEGFVQKQNLMLKSSYGNIRLSNTKCHVFP